MACLDHVDRFVIGRAVDLVGAAEEDVARAVRYTRLVEQQCERHAGPLADRAPALDAVVPGDLRARRHRPQLGERQGERAANQTADLQPPVPKAVRPMRPIRVRRGRPRAVDAKDRRHLRLAIFTRERATRGDQALGAARQAIERIEDVMDGFGIANALAAGQQQTGSQRAEYRAAGIAGLVRHRTVSLG